MLVPALTRFHRRRGQRMRTGPPLVLVSAVYVEVPATTLTLEFDRAITIGDVVGVAILVSDDEQAALVFSATGGAQMLGPATVRFALLPYDDPSGPGIVLNASPLNGIVAVEGGGKWPGVSGLALPFP